MNKTTVIALGQIASASHALKEKTEINTNNLVLNCLDVLYEEGFILSYNVYKSKNLAKARVNLRYLFQNPVFNNLEFASTPGHMKTYKFNKICRMTIKKKLYVFTTSYGVIALDQCKKLNTGGVLLFVL